MDVRALALIVVALVAIGSAIVATVCRARGVNTTKGVFKVAGLTLTALFIGVTALMFVLALSFRF
jgi:hypothetical protein